MPKRSASSLLILSAVGLMAVALWWLRPRQDALVVYCAHDAEFSEPILKEFERRMGIPVVIQFDTEATKSLSLIQRIKAESNQPQCDVFWNNETLGTMDLAEGGFLECYKGSGYERIPEKYKDSEGRWTGFAARLRVLIYHKEKLPEGSVPDTEAEVVKLIEEKPSEFAFAKPMFGTTLTHYSAMWREWGGEKLQEWHRELVKNGGQEVAGNAKSKDLVAGGNCRAGFTDTDDFYVAYDSGKPVGMIPVRLKEGGTICIPNTVGIVKGTDRQESARKLVDYLLSEEVEVLLAKSAARQIPLGKVVEAKIPSEVADLMDEAGEGIDLRELGGARGECLAWLQKEALQ